MTLQTKRLGSLADAAAPDGSEVRVLCQVAGGSMAQFSIPPKAVFRAVAHRRERVKSSVLASAVGRLWVGSGLSGYGWFQGQRGHSRRISITTTVRSQCGISAARVGRR